MRLISSLRELWSYRRLVEQLAARDLKARYKVSVLGFFWSLLRPLLTIVVLAAVFSMLGMQGITYRAPYYILLLTVYMPWFFFSTALLEGTHSLLSNAPLIKKVYCPRAVFPAAVVLSNLVNFLLSLLVVIPAIYILSGAKPSWMLLQLPLAIAVHTAFLFGMCLIASVLNVLYRDTAQVMEFAVFAWFYVSPVLYDSAIVLQKVKSASLFLLYFLNPMAGILEWYRWIFLNSVMQGDVYEPVILSMVRRSIEVGIIYAIHASFLILVAGLFIHKKLETRAVDTL